MDSTHIVAYFIFILVSRRVCIVFSGACPTHFVFISSRCYYVSSMAVEGFEAYTLCNGLYSGATLAVFQTDAEKKNVAAGLSLTNGTRYLIGPHPACESGCYTIRPMATLETPLIGLISCETFLQFICEAPIIYDVPDDVTIFTTTSDSTSITAQWSYSSSSTSYTGFRVTATPSTGAQQSTVNVNSSELSATLSDLYSGTVYNVTVYVLNEDQISTGVSMDSFTYPGYVPCLLATNVGKDITISWSSAAGEVHGYRVWAYVTEKTQEDQETGDPTTLSHTFTGKDKKTYAIDIYSYVWVNGVQYWSFPIEVDFYLDKNEQNEVNEGSYPCTAVTPAPITTTSSPATNTTTYCPVVDIYTTTLPTTTGAPSTLQTTREVTTTMTTTYPTTTAFHTTANPTSTAVMTTSPTTVAQTTTKPATTLLVTTDLTTLQTTHPPLTTPKTTSVSTTDMQTTTNPTTSTPPTTTFHSSTDPTTYPSTTLQTTTNPTTSIPTTLGFTTTVETSHALTSAPQTSSDSSDPQTATQSSAAPSTVETMTPLVETGIFTDILESTQETSSTETNVNTCNSSEGVLNSEDYIALIPNEKANFTQGVISDLIYFMNETRDEETVYSYMETVWPSLFGPNCQPIAPIRSRSTPFMIEVMGATLMEHLLNVTNETLNLAFYDVGIVKEFRMIVNLAVNDSDVNMMFGEISDTFVEIPTAALRNGDCCKALMFILYNEPPLDERKDQCADL
ncbi:mucin-5AC-like [Lytechinus variegatus]|uniref:mucin-5AC-like n=1 Tax=Lytechinus variegatus TaxID=7654 RepID=UPI001BB167D0|nr:mucin-5AC-like [Lytechinus variegatus]